MSKKIFIFQLYIKTDWLVSSIEGFDPKIHIKKMSLSDARFSVVES
jgi:hypothetical protein